MPDSHSVMEELAGATALSRAGREVEAVTPPAVREQSERGPWLVPPPTRRPATLEMVVREATGTQPEEGELLARTHRRRIPRLEAFSPGHPEDPVPD